jgi:long-chain acyl-CoA synthetase
MAITPIRALMHQAQTRPGSTAFIFHEDVWTYRRLADEAERVARGLVAKGVKAGERIALHMMNRPEMLIAYYACLRLGAIAAPLRTAFKFAELAPMLQRLKPALYIGESDLYRMLRRLMSGSFLCAGVSSSTQSMRTTASSNGTS